MKKRKTKNNTRTTRDKAV